jgi:hypothetical protein
VLYVQIHVVLYLVWRISDLIVAINRRRTSATSPLGMLRTRGSPFNALFVSESFFTTASLFGTACSYKPTNPNASLLTPSRPESAFNSSQTKLKRNLTSWPAQSSRMSILSVSTLPGLSSCCQVIVADEESSSSCISFVLGPVTSGLELDDISPTFLRSVYLASCPLRNHYLIPIQFNYAICSIVRF